MYLCSLIQIKCMYVYLVAARHLVSGVGCLATVVRGCIIRIFEMSQSSSQAHIVTDNVKTRILGLFGHVL